MNITHIIYFKQGAITGIDPIVKGLNEGLSGVSGTHSRVVSVCDRSWKSVWLDILSQCDLVVFHAIYVPKYWLLAWRLKLRGVPYVIIPHSSLMMATHRKSRWLKLMCNILFVKSFVRDALLIQFNNLPEEGGSVKSWNFKYCRISNGTCMATQKYIELKKNAHAAWRANAGRGIRLIMLSRYDVHHKGLDILVDRVAQYATALRQTCVTIDMFGPDQKNGRKIVDNLVRQRNIDDIVKVNGPLDRAALADAFMTYQGFLMLSRYEGEPMAVLEAVAHGLPAILSEGTNIAHEFAAKGVAIVATENLVGDIERLILILDDKHLIARCKEALQGRSWDAIARQALAVWTDRLKSPN